MALAAKAASELVTMMKLKSDVTDAISGWR